MFIYLNERNTLYELTNYLLKINLRYSIDCGYNDPNKQGEGYDGKSTESNY